MQLIPVKTPLLHEGNDIATILTQCEHIESGDVLVISSKAIATVEGASINLSTITPTQEAYLWVKRCGGPHAFRQAILNEVQRMHGVILPCCPQAMLTELKPDGLEHGTILAVNAGLDLSNIADGYAIGWPRDPVASVRKLKEELKKEIAVIVSDSCCRPRRIGVAAIALTVAGIDPIKNEIGVPDLFGHPLTMTQEALADQLATAANIVMGNAGESIPAVIIRDHKMPLTSFSGWVPGIARDKDLFCGLLH